MTELFNLPKDAPAETEAKAETKASTETIVAPVENDTAPLQGVTELDMLKNRARVMGIQFSNNISVETLRAKIQAKLDGEKDAPAPQENVSAVSQADQSEAAPEAASPAPVMSPKNQKQSLRQRLMKEEMALVRLRITNLDPKKKDLPGEIITVANEYLGTVRKYVPFGEKTDNGYHVPYVIYKLLKNRKFLSIKTRKDPRTGTPIVESQWAREFALEILPPLTEKELANLAAAQAAAGVQD